MPWRAVSVTSLRLEFVTLAERGEVAFSELCRRFGITRRVGYKWLDRYRAEGPAGLSDRSRRPHSTDNQLPQDAEQAVVALREKRPSWGARKLRRRLQDMGFESVPACSTITAVLHRHGLIGPDGQGGRKDWKRFEHPAPNSLWQMDFKGPVQTLAADVYPLTAVDDHSRFCVCLRALPNQQGPGVKQALTDAFRLYGLPDAILVDNGGPWGCDEEHPYTPFTVWLMRLGILVTHSRPYHPQTLGKDERFHETLEKELLSRFQWRDVGHVQEGFDGWRPIYNFERPHDALGLAVPASRYRPSLRSFPEELAAIEYAAGVHVRRVQQTGEMSFRGRVFRVPKAFCGYPLGIRPTVTEGIFDVLFCRHTIKQIDVRNPE